MTDQEWTNKYYPVEATDCLEDEAVAHSILKWEGVVWAIENQRRVPIRVDADTCALCVHYYESSNEESPKCEKCPLALSLGHTCDGYHMDDDYDRDDHFQAPWVQYNDGKNPHPMLNALRAIES